MVKHKVTKEDMLIRILKQVGVEQLKAMKVLVKERVKVEEEILTIEWQVVEE